MPPNDDITTVLAGIKDGVAGFNTRFDALQKQADAIEQKMQRPGFTGSGAGESLADVVWRHPEFEKLRASGSGRAVIPLDTKTLITSTAVGSATSGVLLFERVPGVVTEARRPLKLINLLRKYPTSNNAVDFIKIDSFSKVVSPQTEGSAKGESEMKFTTVSAPVRTIATWIPATRQVLDDSGALAQAVNEGLMFALEEEIEDQILSGDNTSQNLNGLTTQATAFDTGLLVASDGWEQVDIIGRARQQIVASNGVNPNFVVLHPNNYFGMRLMKDTTGRYIFDRPDGEAGFSPIWGLTPVITTAMTENYFLVGSSDARAAAVFLRMAPIIEVSTEHSTYFTENKVAIRVEARLTLCVFRPASFIYGGLNQSPA